MHTSINIMEVTKLVSVFTGMF